MNAFRSAVVPAAGLGTRFLPATKAIPKEMLPIVDTPTIQLIVDEAARAGAQQVVVKASQPLEKVVDYPAPELVDGAKVSVK